MDFTIKKFSLILVALIFGLLLLEAILNYMHYEYVPLKLIRIRNTENKSDWRTHHIFEDDHFSYDPYLIWRPKKNNPVFNNEGYRGREISSSRGLKTYCIFVFGDSNTLGMPGKDGSNWPGFLDNIIQESKRDCLAVNAGVWGYTLFQGLRRFKEALPLKPDMVLICFGSNDPQRVVTPDKEYISDAFGIRSKIYKYKLGLLLISLSDKLYKKKNIKLVPRVSLEDYKKYLEEIIRLCRVNNIKIVLITRPFTGRSSDTLMWLNFAPHYNDIVKQVARYNNVALIDLNQYFSDKKEYFSDDSHFTDEGYKIAARMIYEEIRDYLPEAKK